MDTSLNPVASICRDVKAQQTCEVHVYSRNMNPGALVELRGHVVVVR